MILVSFIIRKCLLYLDIHSTDSSLLFYNFRFYFARDERNRTGRFLGDLVYIDLFRFHCYLLYVDKREDPKGTSQSSLKYSEDPTDKQSSTVNPSSRRNPGRIPPLETTVRENGLYRRNDGVGRSNGDDRIPLILDPPRRSRPGDVNASASLPQYDRSNNQREYTIPTRKRSEPGESGDAGYYVGRSPEHEQSLPYVEYCTALFHSNPWLLVFTCLYFDALPSFNCCFSIIVSN